MSGKIQINIAQLIKTDPLTPSSVDSRRNGVALSMTNRIKPWWEVINLKSNRASNKSKFRWINKHKTRVTSQLLQQLQQQRHQLRKRMVTNFILGRRESEIVKYLLIPVHEIHQSLMVIVVMSRLGSINWELQIVWAKSVPLSISIWEDSSLEQLIIWIVDTRDDKGRAECKLFILCKEVVDVSIQNQTANWLQGKNILGPSLSYIKWIKIKFVFMIGINCLNVKFPLGVVSSCNWVIEILGSMAMIRSTNLNCLFIQQTLDSTCGFPVKFHVVCLPSLTDKSICINTRTFHMPVILWNSQVIK